MCAIDYEIRIHRFSRWPISPVRYAWSVVWPGFDGPYFPFGDFVGLPLFSLHSGFTATKRGARREAKRAIASRSIHSGHAEVGRYRVSVSPTQEAG
jgi:hypothetical protein